jgi:hypothetical protein
MSDITQTAEFGLQAANGTADANAFRRPLEVPTTDAQITSQIIGDLWELSAQRLDPTFWRPFRRRRYKRLLADYCEILPTIKRAHYHAYLTLALIGVRHLRQGNLAVSKSILEIIKFHTMSGAAITHVMRGLIHCGILLLFIGYMGASIFLLLSLLCKMNPPRRLRLMTYLPAYSARYLRSGRGYLIALSVFSIASLNLRE